ncbi:MAG TPA: class I SAM-dependent methyltransferase [Pirellulaceae bacterium]|nr:class I SAM-dependent methyltransferase [Pirellulaceae bacterium]
MNDPSEILAGYFQLMNLNGAAHVYHEAVRCGLLEALRSGPKSAEELAASRSLALRPVRLLLPALAALGVVQARGEQFALSPLAELLVSSSYRNLGDEYWAHLPELLKTDKPIVRMDDTAKSEAFYQAQAAILGWMLTPAAECAAQALVAEGVADGCAILDLGAGSAVWSLTLARELPGATVTAVDWPAVLEVAAETAQNLGLPDRLTTIAGNYHEVALPASKFDLAILANVTHLETPDGNQALFAKARAALKAGGRIAIFDVFPGQPAGDLNRTLYALGLALRTGHGHVYSVAEFEPLLAAAGFEPPKLVPLAVPPYAVGMLTAISRQ